MNPASLYTYFDSLDDVFTAVILDSFERLGHAMQQAAIEVGGHSAIDRLPFLALAYRRWAVEHPAEFNLIFTDQLPGYAAPPQGPTVAAQTAIFEPFATALADLAGAGRETQNACRLSLDQAGPSGFVALWGTMHGLVMLEINHHLPFLDDHTAVFIEAIERALSSWRR